tara:strand:+ start:7228 stop:7470 length:243 start_codon:yes stop_codon:yes gene_type:complete
MENEFYPDALYDDMAAFYASSYTVYGLKIGHQVHLSTFCVLVLLKKDRLEDQYQRVGIAELPVNSCWNNMFKKKCTITII